MYGWIEKVLFSKTEDPDEKYWIKATRETYWIIRFNQVGTLQV